MNQSGANPIHYIIVAIIGIACIVLGVVAAVTLTPTDDAVPEDDVTIASALPAPSVVTSVEAGPPVTPTSLAEGVVEVISSPQAPPASTFTQIPTPSLVPIVPTPRTATETPAATEPASLFPRPVDEGEVEAILSRLTLPQKLAQMQMIGLSGSTITDLSWGYVANMGVGGVIYLDSNARGPEQTRRFSEQLQQAAMQNGAQLPLFIAWNHEGGDISRLLAGMTYFPSSMAVGATGRSEFAYDVGHAMGEEMRSLGLNMNYAPVLDVNTEPANPVIGLRAYGDDPQKVSLFGRLAIRGLQSAGVIAVAKHFPGHGGVDVDSHLALPYLDHSREELNQTDLPPFISSIDSDVGGIMVAHLDIGALNTSGRPSSLSKSVVTDLLRQELAYEGVIMTDALGMQAVTNYYSPDQAAVQAVLAGNDMLISVDSQDYPRIIQNALLAAVSDQTIDEDQINESVRRIIRLKLAYDLAEVASDPPLLSREANQALANDVGEAAVQIVQYNQEWLPLPRPNNRVVVVSPATLDPGPVGGNGLTLLGEKLVAQGVNVTEFIYDHTSPASVLGAAASAKSLQSWADSYVVVTWDAILRQAQFNQTAQADLVSELVSTGLPTVTVFGHLPYDAQLVPAAPVQLATYGDTNGQIDGLVRLLLHGR